MATFSKSLETTLHSAMALAEKGRHEYMTLEHVLAALTDDAEAVTALTAVGGDAKKLRGTVDNYLATELGDFTTPAGQEVATPLATDGVRRVLVRALLHATSYDSPKVYGDEVLLALFSERGSHAAFFLEQQDISRYDLVPYVSDARAKRMPAVATPGRSNPPAAGATGAVTDPA